MEDAPMPIRLFASLLLALLPLASLAAPVAADSLDAHRAVPVDTTGTAIGAAVPMHPTGTVKYEEFAMYPDARASLVERIRLVTPEWDQELPFVAQDVTGGPIVPIEQLVDDVTRHFELRGGTPGDDGANGYAFDRWRAPMTLLVRYSMANPGRTELQMATDIPRLVHALIHPTWPAAWDESIESVTPPGPPTVTELRNADGPIARLLSLRFDLIYRDAGGLG